MNPSPFDYFPSFSFFRSFSGEFIHGRHLLPLSPAEEASPAVGRTPPQSGTQRRPRCRLGAVPCPSHVPRGWSSAAAACTAAPPPAFGPCADRREGMADVPLPCAPCVAAVPSAGRGRGPSLPSVSSSIKFPWLPCHVREQEEGKEEDDANYRIATGSFNLRCFFVLIPFQFVPVALVSCC